MTISWEPRLLLGLAALLASSRRAAPRIAQTAGVVLLLGPTARLNRARPGRATAARTWRCCCSWAHAVDSSPAPARGGGRSRAVVAMGLLSLPAAAALDRRRGVGKLPRLGSVGSARWSPSIGPTSTVHSTGPATAQRCSTYVPTAAYWKARRSTASTACAGSGLPATGDDVSSELPATFGQRRAELGALRVQPRWDEEIDVTVRSLSSELVLGAGTVYRIDGVAHSISGDGTSRSRPSR